MGYSLPTSSIHGILPARILEWVAISSSKGSSRPRNWTRISHISCIVGRFCTAEPPRKPFHLPATNFYRSFPSATSPSCPDKEWVGSQEWFSRGCPDLWFVSQASRRCTTPSRFSLRNLKQTTQLSSQVVLRTLEGLGCSGWWHTHKVQRFLRLQGKWLRVRRDQIYRKKNIRESERNRSEGHVSPRSCLGLDLIEVRLCTIP